VPVPLPLHRRTFLRLTGDFALLALLPHPALAEILEERLARPEAAGVFLSAERMRALRALCAHWVPGPPDDPDPGAAEAGVADYIDLLLGAFGLEQPHIFAGGPFSHRDGGGPGWQWLPLDALEERVWRTRIEGSRGLPEREWKGPVRGWQETYATGLDALDASARRFLRAPFAELGTTGRSAILGWLPGGPDDAFLELAFRQTLEGMYGAPEYGGNRGRVGWAYTRWPGDHQPHAYSLAEIAEPDRDQAGAVARARARARDVLGFAEEAEWKATEKGKAKADEGADDA
jgi:hypothetical protein